MAKKKTTNDEVFGELTYSVGDGWKRPIELNIFGQDWTIDLMVDIEQPGGIEQSQIDAYTAYIERTPTIVAAAEKAIFDYYKSICKEYRDRFGIADPNDKRIPIIKSKSDVFKLIQPEGVIFPYVRPLPTFGILCQCTWEEEHGLAVKFENGTVTNVGFQDIVL